MFHKSPTKDEILLKHIQAQLNTELKLILDSKTRWNSLLEMIKIFVRAETCIRMALVEIGTSTTITNAEIKILHDLIDVLEPAIHAVDELCRRKATLLTAKRIRDFVFKTLSNYNSPYSASLKSRLEVKIKDRRNTCLVHLLEYLRDPNFVMENKFYILGEYGNKNKMYTLAATLMQKLFGIPGPSLGEESEFASLASTSVCRDSSRVSLEEELERAITSASIPATRSSLTPNLNRRRSKRNVKCLKLLGYGQPTFKLSMNLCLLFSPLLWKQKEHSVHVDSLLQNSGLVYPTPQSTYCAL